MPLHSMFNKTIKSPFGILSGIKNELASLYASCYTKQQYQNLKAMLFETAAVITTEPLDPSLKIAAWFLMADIYAWRLTGPQGAGAQQALEQAQVCLEHIRTIYKESNGIDTGLVARLNTRNISSVGEADELLKNAGLAPPEDASRHLGS